MPLQPYRNFRFKVEVAGLSAGGFSEVTGFDATFDVVEYREGDYEITPMKLPGLMKYGNITLKQGVADNTVIYDWLIRTYNGDIELKTITITLVKEDGSDGPQWQVINAWPVKYTAPDFNATSSEVAFESIELAHEGLTRLNPGGTEVTDGSGTARKGGSAGGQSA